MKIKFKSIKIHLFVLLVIITIISGAAILFSFFKFINYNPKGMARPTVVIAGLVIGVPLYWIILFIIKTLKQEYILEINVGEIEIKSKFIDEIISYDKIENVIIYNNTDYAKIIINTNIKKYKFNIGFANLGFSTYFNNKMAFKLIDSFDELDRIFSKNMLKRTVENRKGIDIVKYIKNK
jgi:hypothetical protein